jgi:2-amino-4-hydroxy-6-hydroxymethyldihydropteridine diphosphokinase
MKTILGLGTNVGHREAQLERAVGALEGVLEGSVCSPVYVSEAVLLPDSPPEWNLPYLNMAIMGECRLAPEALLDAVKAIEKQLERQDRGRWGPREIDIDILAMGDMVLDTPALTIPHPRLAERNFALQPLADLAPDWVHPVLGKTAKTLIRTGKGSPLTLHLSKPREENA